MGFLDRILGKSASQPAGEQPREAQMSDEQAIERYRYLLRTAPPEAIEQAHAEAFAQLTPEQRARVLKELSEGLPPAERANVPAQPDAQSLARLATRAELRQPGTMERIFGGGGMGMGGMFGGSLLSSIAGGFIGSAIAHQLLGGFPGDWHGDERRVATTGAVAQADSTGSEDDGDGDFDDGYDDDGGDVGGDMGGDFGDV